MTQRQWEQLKDLFAEALEQSPEDLEAFVTQVKETEPPVYDELRRLLAEHQSSPDGLRQPALLTPVEASPRFSTGTLLAQRFRIVEFLARGGMGEVYEAEDLQLGEHVALKAIRRDIAGNPRVLAQFKQEVQLARKVTHPNVCRIFDLIHLEDGADLLSMELVRGETLSSYLQQHGPMTPLDALPLVEQIASALDAAHEANVIHGDLKPGNVILTSGTKKRTRAVVMDFGLALRASETTHSSARRHDGTPDYMAPEQLEGRPLTPATDIYAFGLLIRSMVCERRDDSAGVWEEVLQRCRQPDAALRYGRAAEVLAALHTAIDGPPPGRGPMLRRSFGIAAAVGIVGVMLRQPWRTRPLAYQQGNLVLLEAFENRTGEPLFDGTLKAVIERELSNSQFVGIADQQRVDDALRLMRRAPDTRLDRALARETALRDGGITLLVTGRVESDRGVYRLTVDLVDPVTDKTLRTKTDRAAGTGQVWPAARRLSNWVRESLGEQITHIDRSNRQMEKVTTPSLKAFQLFSQADKAAKRSDWPNAVEFSRQALAEDPNLASAHIWLAWALQNLRRPEWEYEAHRAQELASTATERERYFIEASNYMLARQYDQAIPVLQELVKSYPDHYFGNRNLATAYIRVGRRREAEDTLARVADLRPNDFRSQVDATEVLTRPDSEAASRASQYARRALSVVTPDTEISRQDVLAVFTPAFEALNLGRSNAAAEVDSIAAKAEVLQNSPTWEFFLRWVVEYYLVVGQVRRARHWLDQMPAGPMREEVSPFIAFAWGAMSEASIQLSRIPSPQLSPVRILKARFQPADAPHILAQDIVEQQRFNAQNPQRPQPSPQKPTLAGDLEPYSRVLDLLPGKLVTQIFAEPVAEGLQRQGKLKQAIEVLENAGKLTADITPVCSLRNQVLLAEYYREDGREGEARVLEDRLRNILSAADPDFPMLKRLSH